MYVIFIYIQDKNRVKAAMMRTGTQSEFLKICRETGWKCTAQRLAVYGFLNGNGTHPDVDTVLSALRKTLPTISRESVYRILNEFSEHGIIARMDHIDNARYDARTEAHGHFICEKCGDITDFDWPEGAVIPRDALPEKLSHMEIRIVGLCRRCEFQAEKNEFNNPPYKEEKK